MSAADKQELVAFTLPFLLWALCGTIAITGSCFLFAVRGANFEKTALVLASSLTVFYLICALICDWRGHWILGGVFVALALYMCDAAWKQWKRMRKRKRLREFLARIAERGRRLVVVPT